ncbi:MAG: response regulator [Alphaproteobacteria bacterium]|nr:response regulator [Alphaproteobacteria bacterium]
MTKVLVVEDDAEIRALVARYLSANDIVVAEAAHAREMDVALRDSRIDLIVLDIMLPGEDGLSICRRIRAVSSVPIIILTALKDDVERVIGLEMGADDYVTKPFNPRELLARIRAVLRRQAFGGTLAQPLGQEYQFAGWQLDIRTRRLHDPNGTRVALTGAEFDLLAVFCERPGRVLSRDQLIDLTQGRQPHPSERSVDILVSRLRQKMERNPRDPEFFQTVRSSGYVFTPEVVAK